MRKEEIEKLIEDYNDSLENKDYQLPLEKNNHNEDYDYKYYRYDNNNDYTTDFDDEPNISDTNFIKFGADLSEYSTVNALPHKDISSSFARQSLGVPLNNIEDIEQNNAPDVDNSNNIPIKEDDKTNIKDNNKAISSRDKKLEKKALKEQEKKLKREQARKLKEEKENKIKAQKEKPAKVQSVVAPKIEDNITEDVITDTDTQKKKKGLVGDIIFYSSLLLLLVAVVLFKSSDGRAPTTFFGHSVFTVLTSSMQDEIPKGSLVLTKRIDPEKLEIGDNITYLNGSKTTITHKIIAIQEDFSNTGQRGFKTKGTANKEPDRDIVPAINVVGKVIFSNYQLGLVATFIKNYWYFILILILLVYFFIKALRGMFASKDDEEDEDNNKKK